MSEHSPASTSHFSTIYPEGAALDQQRSTSADTLTRQAREQAAQAGDYLARNVQEYPFGALLLAGLLGYGLGYLFHAGWSSGTRKPLAQSYPDGHSGDVLRPLESTHKGRPGTTHMPRAGSSEAPATWGGQTGAAKELIVHDTGSAARGSPAVRE